MVEQRTENPCVPGSILGDTTERETSEDDSVSFSFFMPFPKERKWDRRKNKSAELSFFLKKVAALCTTQKIKRTRKKQNKNRFLLL